MGFPERMCLRRCAALEESIFGQVRFVRFDVCGVLIWLLSEKGSVGIGRNEAAASMVITVWELASSIRQCV